MVSFPTDNELPVVVIHDLVLTNLGVATCDKLHLRPQTVRLSINAYTFYGLAAEGLVRVCFEVIPVEHLRLPAR